MRVENVLGEQQLLKILAFLTLPTLTDFYNETVGRLCHLTATNPETGNKNSNILQ